MSASIDQVITHVNEMSCNFRKTGWQTGFNRYYAETFITLIDN